MTLDLQSRSARAATRTADGEDVLLPFLGKLMILANTAIVVSTLSHVPILQDSIAMGPTGTTLAGTLAVLGASILTWLLVWHARCWQRQPPSVAYLLSAAAIVAYFLAGTDQLLVMAHTVGLRETSDASVLTRIMAALAVFSRIAALISLVMMGMCIRPSTVQEMPESRGTLLVLFIALLILAFEYALAATGAGALFLVLGSAATAGLFIGTTKLHHRVGQSTSSLRLLIAGTIGYLIVKAPAIATVGWLAGLPGEQAAAILLLVFAVKFGPYLQAAALLSLAAMFVATFRLLPHARPYPTSRRA